MPLTYVIPDLHGRRDLLDAALARIETHAAGAALTLVVLGDYVDKGPDSRGAGRIDRAAAGRDAGAVADRDAEGQPRCADGGGAARRHRHG